MRLTKFGSTDFDELSQKYTKSEELEPVENPEKEYKKSIGILAKSSSWNE